MNEQVKDEVRQRLSTFLESANRHKTPERFAILDAVYSQEKPFTLVELGAYMDQVSHFSVSRATLYNTMRLFMDLRLVVRHRFQGETSYEACYARTGQCQQVCTICGSTRDIAAAQVESAIQSLRLNRFRKDGFALYIYGVCNKCRAQQKKDKKK